ncbi:cytochrome c oxidase subunit 7 [Geosmithia morbida]|uniref:Cytochrome c oxidase subunit 7 n=1 Tax=Geosmithia morbida TaxID=1094350 RepID=A0A9P4YU08_9HYPO|nr:cytochrome c oxidase subunit 7 [Geosmithia morbida]KAF4121792.1 cytochrome c oxidase subunit 7 [Geosmithia morbida]
MACSLINAKNNVPYHQRAYQAAYKAHTRLWMINSRSRFYIVPYTALIWGTFAATMYAGCRKVLGKNTWFSS